MSAIIHVAMTINEPHMNVKDIIHPKLDLPQRVKSTSIQHIKTYFRAVQIAGYEDTEKRGKILVVGNTGMYIYKIVLGKLTEHKIFKILLLL